MKLLLDTHILLDILKNTLRPETRTIEDLIARGENRLFVSTASLWEIAIKTRLGKLDPGMNVPDIARYAEMFGATIVDINRHHAVAEAEPVPATRDPFDRMLLAQCSVEGLRLVTYDSVLVGHPLAWHETIPSTRP